MKSGLKVAGSSAHGSQAKKVVINGTTSSRSSPGLQGPVVNGGLSDYDMPLMNGHDSDSAMRNGGPRKSDEAQWFTRPAHLDRAYSALRSPSPSAAMGFIRTKTITSPVHHAHRHTKHSETSPVASTDISKSKDISQLAQEYFPLTLSAGYSIRAATLDTTPVSKSLTFSPPPKGLKRPSSAPWKPKRSKSPSRKRPGSAHSAHSSSSSNSRHSAPVEKMYLLSSEAPVTGKCFKS